MSHPDRRRKRRGDDTRLSIARDANKVSYLFIEFRLHTNNDEITKT